MAESDCRLLFVTCNGSHTMVAMFHSMVLFSGYGSASRHGCGPVNVVLQVRLQC